MSSYSYWDLKKSCDGVSFERYKLEEDKKANQNARAKMYKVYEKLDTKKVEKDI